jgi:hypothetical protein
MPRARARRRNPTNLPRLTLAPSGFARARPPGCRRDQVGRAAASRAGSGRLPPGGPSGKPPASPRTGRQIDRLPARAVTSAEISTAVGARDHLINATIALWTVAIASGIVLLALPPVCTRPNTATRLEVLRRLSGRVRHVYWLIPEPHHDWDTTNSVMSAYAPTATRCSRSATCAS